LDLWRILYKPVVDFDSLLGILPLPYFIIERTAPFIPAKLKPDVFAAVHRNSGDKNIVFIKHRILITANDPIRFAVQESTLNGVSAQNRGVGINAANIAV
jgi:hypothetical protein